MSRGRPACTPLAGRLRTSEGDPSVTNVTGPDNYLAANYLLAQAEDRIGESRPEDTAAILAQIGTGRAVLALAAASALNHGGGEGLHSADWDAWHKVAGESLRIDGQQR